MLSASVDMCTNRRARDAKTGACGSLYNIASDERLNHRIEIIAGVLADDASTLLGDFFRRRRITDN